MKFGIKIGLFINESLYFHKSLGKPAVFVCLQLKIVLFIVKNILRK